MAEMSGFHSWQKSWKKNGPGLIKIANRITAIRSAAAIEFSKQVENELQLLAMPKARLNVKVNSRTGESDSDLQIRDWMKFKSCSPRTVVGSYYRYQKLLAVVSSHG